MFLHPHSPQYLNVSTDTPSYASETPYHHLPKQPSHSTYTLSSPSSPRAKRPPNAFIIFRSEVINREELRQYHSNQTEISQIVGELWRNLSESEKEVYYQAAEVRRVKHRTEFPHFVYHAKNTVTPRKTKRGLGSSGRENRSEKGWPESCFSRRADHPPNTPNKNTLYAPDEYRGNSVQSNPYNYPVAYCQPENFIQQQPNQSHNSSNQKNYMDTEHLRSLMEHFNR
ncbi:hypothetical protein Clacol_009230 [Clathrus columnatus]|uniref:HMG box domain-containing protein n=1 Tax=Clathrus columnatus TaxID=1419009 RepID=A0AAV5AQ67_9AGAM|nr:hypothetical protein Clacol_009230 [Clathrus columnatus]